MSHIPPFIISFYCIKSLRHRINSLLRYSQLKMRFFLSRSFRVLQVVVCVIIGDQRAFSFFFCTENRLRSIKKAFYFVNGFIGQSSLNASWNQMLIEIRARRLKWVQFPFFQKKRQKNDSHQCCEVNLIENHMMWSSSSWSWKLIMLSKSEQSRMTINLNKYWRWKIKERG